MENKNTFEYPKITIVNPLSGTNLTIPYMYKNYDKIFHYKGVIYPILYEIIGNTTEPSEIFLLKNGESYLKVSLNIIRDADKLKYMSGSNIIHEQLVLFNEAIEKLKYLIVNILHEVVFDIHIKTYELIPSDICNKMINIYILKKD